MAATKPHRGQRLLVQALASGITGLLLAGGAAWGAGAPSETPPPQAPVDPTEPAEQELQRAVEPDESDESDELDEQAVEEADPPAATGDTAQEAKPPKADKAAKAKGPETAKAAKARGPKAAKAQGRALGQGNGQGNGHGKAVSAAARGESELPDDCRNHGHWVSTVAKGLDSCTANPRPPETETETDDTDD